MKNVNNFLLTEKITVGETMGWIKLKDDHSKNKLIELIHHLFYNRYIKHLDLIDSGFLKMAVSCLTIEALESFRQGKKNTKGKGVGEQIFKDFFEIEKSLFPGFKDIYSDFYSNIRCGILHQAETTKEWRILRKNNLLDKKNKAINATKFVKALNKALDNYINTLKQNDFNSQLWKNAILKIVDICENCKASR